MMTEVDLSQLAIDRDDAPRRKTASRRNFWTRYVLPLGLLAGFLALVGWGARDIVSPPTAVTVVPVLATQSAVQPEGALLFKAAGWVEPRPTPVRAAALAPGVVEELLVVEDQPVRAGQPVAELVKDEARLACARAEADLKLQQALVSEAEAARRAAQTRFEHPVHLDAALNEAESALSGVETLLANLPHETRRAEARFELARRDYEGKTAAKNAVSGLAVQQARSEFDAARALVDELRERAASLGRERAALERRRVALQTQRELLAEEIQARDESMARVDAARARVEQTQVALSEAKLRLDRMTVRAPVDGRVYQLVGHPGTTLTGGMGVSASFDGSTVITLYQPERLQVRVDVRFEDIPRVSLGQLVRIENPALSEPLNGRVLFISSLADIQKNTLEVKVGLNETPTVLKPEMLVDATFLAPAGSGDDEPSEEMRLYVPAELIIQDGSDRFVWVADQSAGVARRVRVATGAAGPEGFVEVTSGLTLASRLITSGRDRLSDGGRIRIAGEDEMNVVTRPDLAGSRRAPLSRLPAGGHE